MDVRGLIIDIDGTLCDVDRPLPGAVEAVLRLRRHGLPLRFATNTTRRPRSDVLNRLQAAGFEVSLEELFTAPTAAAAWLNRNGIEHIAACVAPATLEDFRDFTLDEHRPQAVVVGDLGRDWTFDRTNRAFLWLLGGARLVALQKNRYWKSEEGLTIDAGAWVAALEYASGRTATVVGKPSREFFGAAIESMHLAPAEVGVVGDDLTSDIAGARNVGARGILVRTGKFRQEDLERADASPELVLDSIAALPDRIGASGRP